MELRALRYFLAVAREENITGAANFLHITQPTLSRQIAELESELGKKLFMRTNRSTLLTADGMRLRQRAEEILSLVERTEVEIADNDSNLVGKIRIGAAEAGEVSLLAEAFASLQREHPRLEVELFSGNADAVKERLAHGLLDIGLLLAPVHLEPYEALALPGKIRVGIIMCRDNPLATCASITPDDLPKLKLLVSSRNENPNYDLIRWSQGTLQVKDINIQGRYDLLGNAVRFVKATGFCALCIEGLAPQLDPTLAFIPLEPVLTTRAFVVWKKYRLFSRPVEAFLTLLRERYKK